MTLTGDQDRAVREAVAQRLADEGRPVAPSELRISAATPERLDDLVLFRAVHGQGEQIGVLQGVVAADGSVNTYPNDALVQVWRRWLASGGLPGAGEVVRTSLFLIGGEDKKTVVLDDADRAAVADPHDRPKVRLPRLLDPAEGTGVVFWWLRRNRLSEVTLRLEDDMIGLSERDVSRIG